MANKMFPNNVGEELNVDCTLFSNSLINYENRIHLNVQELLFFNAVQVLFQRFGAKIEGQIL